MEAPNGRSVVSRVGRRGVCRLRRSRPCPEEDRLMIAILWGAGAVVVAVYMVAALLRPERF
ncbi:potassium-transporting ATPase subunit F [Brevundimonas goettingensis]|uniref:Potassium-transporting ATPase subunit F n=1 Tax=Brevundimonas goettingensis TaxID=2774190 RepID=A0A975C047_9CAUL|nr:potassium-transporting ATPase subunit F [Brevundimonas goettingensis]